MIIKENILLSAHTTIKLGGPAKYFIECDTEGSIKEALEFAKEKNCKVQTLSGGSNIIFADHGFDGVILKINIKGVTVKKDKDNFFVCSGAGENWDEFVKYCIENEITGAECLSGIPGSVGATPVQNVGAYGQEVSGIIYSLKAIERESLETRIFRNEDCRFAYRESIFKSAYKDKFIITEVVFKMKKKSESEIKYPELKKYIDSQKEYSGLNAGKEKLNFIRNAVLSLRKKKSMVIDNDDPNTISCGSFFTNPVMSVSEFEKFKIKTDSINLLTPYYINSDKDKIKIPAAWLIEQSGFEKGYKTKGAGISTKHSLAIINRGGKTSDIISLSEEIIRTVKNKFGIVLVNEPVIVN